MYGNKRRTIGVFLERAKSEFQNKLSQGIITKAEELGYNVAVFSCYGNYGQNDRYFEGDQNLWELPPYEELDGIIMALDTMDEKASRENVLSHVHSRARCPIVSIREVVEGANNLLVDNTTCMNGIIDHFVKDHGLKHLCFMTGPEDHWDARQRMDCFKRRIQEYDLPLDEHQLFWGDFWKNKGKEACDWFLGGKEQPEAILCANDYMALAVTSELIDRGYHIPEDIRVSGYDGMHGTLSFTPSITTVVVPFFEMGSKAVELIHQKQECPQDVENVYFDAVVEKRESCGCMRGGGRAAMVFRQKLYEIENVNQNREMQFHFMSIHLGECHTIEEVAERITYYAYNIDGFKDYCVCLCDHLLEKTDFSGFSDKMELRIAVRNRETLGPMRVPFERKELLPDLMTSDEPQIWYFAPLHFQNFCFGYEALSFYDTENTGSLYLYWNIIIGNQIQDILTHQKMQNLIGQLEEMYDRDALTGMYNRRGFENYGNPMFDQAKEKGEPIFLAIIDMDGMKQINDGYGHIEGDFALCKLRDAIGYACPDGVIQARTGGDEFEIIARGVTESEGLSYLQKLEDYLREFNESATKEYDIHASCGYAYRIPVSEDSMEQFIKESDEVMYQNKQKNKMSRGEVMR